MKNRDMAGFLSKHIKSSALAFTIIIHAALIITAIFAVVITIHVRPKLAPPKGRHIIREPLITKIVAPFTKTKATVKKPIFQPVKIQNKLPQFEKEVVWKNLDTIVGLNSVSDSERGEASLIGFNLRLEPKAGLFNRETRGEKFFIILDASNFIMVDELGGIPAYSIIKGELIRAVDELSPAALFNVAIYDRSSAYALFPKMVPASQANAQKVKEWLDPLNSIRPEMGANDYGVASRGSSPQEVALPGNITIDPLNETYYWLRPALAAMQQQADVVYILTEGWRDMYKVTGAGEQWTESKRIRWNKLVAKAENKLAAENETRRNKGEPPRILPDQVSLVHAYFPNAERPPLKNRYYYTVRDIISGMRKTHKRWSPEVVDAVLRKNKKDPSINVIQFVRTENADGRHIANFQQLARMGDGYYQPINGLKAIKSHSLTEENEL